LFFFTQTTLSVDDTQAIMDALRERFPEIHGPKTNDICYATQNRQDSVKQLALECDLVLVIGSINSSNSNRLREIAERGGVESYLIDSLENLDHKWLEGKEVIGITSGASAPEHLVKELVELLQNKYGCSLYGEEERADEGISFRLPKGLRSL
jgi:4-hydroxy-3-methylbut-2-enyl diphosphate reductase